MGNPVVGVVHSSRHGTVSRELAKDQIEFNCEEKKTGAQQICDFSPITSRKCISKFWMKTDLK